MPSNPYDTLIDDDIQRRQGQLAGSLSTAVDTNPDAFSAQRRVAKYLGYPTAAVEALPKETKTQAAVKQVTEATANSPVLQNKYLEPDFARLAHDDAPKLTEIEQAVRQYGELKAWKGPTPTTGSVLTGLAQSLPQGVRAMREGLRQQMGDLFDTLGILPRTEQEKAEQLRRTAQAQGASAYTTPDFESSTAGAVYGGLTSVLRQAPGIALSVATGNPVPALASIGVQTQAEAYGKYRARGATPGQAAVGGVAEGAIEVGTELLPMGFLVNKLGKTGMTEFFTGMLARELPTEQVATLLQDAVDTAIANPDKTWQQYLNERPEAAYQTLVATITQSAVMAGAGAAARRAMRDTNRVNDAEGDAQRLTELFAKAGESKLRERDPTSFAELVQGVADQTEGAPKSVFIDAATLAEALKSPGAAEVFNQMPQAVQDQLPEALASGGAVELPIGDLVAHASGTPLGQVLLQNLRTAPYSLSQLEAQEAAGQAETYLQAEATRVIEEATNADAMRTSAEVVKANVLGQLNKTMRFRPEVNESYASLAGAFYTTMAGRLNITPEEMFAKYPLRITAEQPGGGVLDQGGAFDFAIPEDGNRIVDVKVGSTTVSLNIKGRWSNPEGVVDVASVRTPAAKRGAGSARAAMQDLVEQADAQGVTLRLDASPLDRKTRGDKLVAFYESLGFTPTGRSNNAVGDPEMVRPPRQTLAQGDQAPRATFSPSRMEIALLKDADLSSFLHEMGHFFLEVQADLASQPGAPQQVIDDFNTTLKWFGVKGDEKAGGADSGVPLNQMLPDFSAMQAKIDQQRRLTEMRPEGSQIRAVGERALQRLTAEMEASQAKVAPVLAKLEGTKIVDPKGRPLEVHHGGGLGPATDGKFKRKRTRSLWFSSAGVADTYAGQGEGSTVYPVYLNSTNPMEFDAQGATWQELSFEGERVSTDDLSDIAEARGHDGLVIRNLRDANTDDGGDEVADHFAVFDPKQIVSSISGEVLGQNGPTTGAPAPTVKRTPAETWAAMTLDQKRQYHERWAESFEMYLFEGKAPSVEMRGVFQRFREFMISAYKSLKAFMAGRNLRLSDEVRGVFDRLLATDEQIAEAQSLANFEAVFKSAEEAGMTPEEWAAYQAQNAAATLDATEDLQKKSLADMKWAAAARGKALRAAQADVKEKRDAMRAEVKAEVEALPVEQARAYIKALRTSTPEQRDALKDWGDRREAAQERAREEVKAALLATPEAAELKGIKKGQFLSKNKKALENQAEAKVIAWEQENPRPTPKLPEPQMETIAEQFGFTSGDELARTLAEQPPAAQFIDALTEQRLLETYGEVVTADGMARAANEAVHNEARRRFVATELAAMQRAMSATAPTGKTTAKGRPLSTNVIVQAAKSFAETVVNRRKILDLKPAQHAAAATRAAAKALKLQAEGKTADAIAAKRDQLLSEYTARYTAQAAAEVKRSIEYLKKFDKASVREKLPADYLDQIDQMLERFDLRTSTTAREIDRRASLASWVAKQQEMGLDPVVPQDLLDNARLTSYKQMTVEEFRGLVDGVKSVEHLARLKSKLLAAKDKREFDAIVAEAVDSIREHGGKPRPVQLEPDGRIKKFFKGAWADHRKFNSLIRQMDGGLDNGPMYRILVRSMNDAGASEATRLEQATEALAKIYAPIEKLPGGFSGAKVFIPEIRNSLSRAGRLSVALNWGNPQNRQRVMDGDGWTEAQVNAILATLSPVELKFVNDVWAHIDSYWADIKAKQERVTGVAEEKVEAVPFELNGVQMRGGYYPIKYDTERSIKAEKQEALETAKQIMQGMVARPTTRRGHTKARVEEVKGRPVRKDLSVITQHVNQVVHDLAWHEWFIDANRILNDPRVAVAIREYHGNETARTLKETADAIAVGDAAHQGQIDRLLLMLRSNVSRSVMGASLTTAIMQPFGLTQSMARVGVVPVLKGAARWAGESARMESTVGWINEKSEFMRLRSKTFNRELREISQRVQGKSKIAQVYDTSLFMLMQKLQLVADVPTWVGAYEKALAGGVDDSAAVALADEAVLGSQGGGTTKDLAAVQRNMPFLTQFYSYFNTTLNLVAEKTATTEFRDPKAVAGWMADMALLTVIPAILPALLTFLLKGGGEDDDAEKWAKRVLEWQAGYLFGMFVGLRELPTIWSPFDYAGPPAGKIVGDGKKVVQQAGQGEIDEPAVLATINLLGTAFGIPTIQATRSYKGWKAWSEGDAPASSILFGPPPRD